MADAKQQKFLDVLFQEAKGNIRAAMNLAGYSKNTRLKEVTVPLADEIALATKNYLALSAPAAAFAMNDVINNPTNLGNKDRMAAAKDLMDRAGLKATDKVEVSAPNPLFILPPKED